MVELKEYAQFSTLLIFGNIENLILEQRLRRQKGGLRRD